MSEWQDLSLEEAGVQLLDCDHRTPPARDSGFPYISIPQLQDGRVILAGARLIDAADFVDWTRKTKPQGHDVVLSRRCNPGVTAFVEPGTEMALGQNLVLLRADGTRVYPPFLRWLVQGAEWWEQVAGYINVGAVFDSLKCADIPKFRLSIPPLPEQKRIAHILGTLDDKIELNRRMCQTLEEMARALFKSWFVDFDPVRAKAQGRQPFGMDAATAALFPDSFVDSEMGMIPTGWEVKALDEIAVFLNGLALQKYPAREGEPYLPVIKIAELRRGVTEQSGRASLGVPAEYVVEDGDLLFSWSGSLEAVIWAGGRGALNQHLFKVTSHRFPKWFYYHWVLEHLPAFQSIAAGKATTMGHIQRHHLSDALCVVPVASVLAAAGRTLGPVFYQLGVNCLESRRLSQLRDALLPRLLNGAGDVDRVDAVGGQAGRADA